MYIYLMLYTLYFINVIYLPAVAKILPITTTVFPSCKPPRSGPVKGIFCVGDVHTVRIFMYFCFED